MKLKDIELEEITRIIRLKRFCKNLIPGRLQETEEFDCLMKLQLKNESLV